MQVKGRSSRRSDMGTSWDEGIRLVARDVERVGR